MDTVATGAPAQPPPVPATPPIPPLENGDRLTREEFERRYEAMPRLKKAELIEGVVHMPSPVRWNQHAGPHADMITWLGFYRAMTRGVRAGDNGSLRLDLGNESQPDGALLIEPAFGGQATISEDDYVVGAPELAAEVSASSVTIDLHAKFRAYQQNGVQEYVVWRVLDRAVDWFVLREGQFQRLSPGADGILRSEVFSGLWLDPAALASFDLAGVLRVLQQGIASPEHAAFVTRLQQRQAGGA
jgi:Uma2 family endonuclease